MIFCGYLQTVSFLTYLLKSFADYIKPHEESICKSIINLLVTCSDLVSIRKVSAFLALFGSPCILYSLESDIRSFWLQELLVALKHVLGTDFRRGLFPLIDTLLDERYIFLVNRVFANISIVFSVSR